MPQIQCKRCHERSGVGNLLSGLFPSYLLQLHVRLWTRAENWVSEARYKHFRWHKIGMLHWHLQRGRLGGSGLRNRCILRWLPTNVQEQPLHARFKNRGCNLLCVCLCVCIDSRTRAGIVSFKCNQINMIAGIKQPTSSFTYHWEWKPKSSVFPGARTASGVAGRRTEWNSTF